MPFTPSYFELCVKLYIGQENSIKHLPGEYVTSDLRLISDTLTVNVAIRCVSWISTLSSMFIQQKDLSVRIETPPALRAVGVSIRTCRSFYWMNTSDKVDILYIMPSYLIRSEIQCKISGP